MRPIITKLANGIRVVSVESPGHFVSAGVFVKAGSRFEDETLVGASHFIDKMAFKSTKDYTSENLIKQLEELGGNVVSSSSKEHIMYQASVFRPDLPKIIPILASIVQRPLFKEEEIQDTRVTTGYEIRDNEHKADLVMPDLLHQVAFGNETLNTLGHPLVCPSERLNLITPELLHRYRSIWFTPNRIVVAGVGMPHQELQDLAAEHFGNMSEIDPQLLEYQKLLSPPANYTGGTRFVDTTHLPPSPNPDDIPLTHVYLGFESVPSSDPDVYAIATLGSLFGGGGSFSAGGPGKGMYSRFYRLILNQHHWVENCNNINQNYSDTGLFGVFASVHPHANTHRAVVPVLCDQLVHASTEVGSEELSRAKNQLKSNLLMGVESKLVQLEDLGRQVLMHNNYVDLSETCKRIDMLKPADITRVAKRLFFGENIVSPYEFNDGVCKHSKKTGNNQASVVVKGPLDKGDALYKVDKELASWSIGKENKSKYFNRLRWR